MELWMQLEMGTKPVDQKICDTEPVRPRHREPLWSLLLSCRHYMFHCMGSLKCHRITEISSPAMHNMESNDIKSFQLDSIEVFGGTKTSIGAIWWLRTTTPNLHRCYLLTWHNTTLEENNGALFDVRSARRDSTGDERILLFPIIHYSFRCAQPWAKYNKNYTKKNEKLENKKKKSNAWIP